MARLPAPAPRERLRQHRSAELATAMDPELLAAQALTVVLRHADGAGAGQGLVRRAGRAGLLREPRTFVAHARPGDALFRANHASNHLPIGGRLPRERDAILAAVDAALAGEVALRPEWMRGM